MLEILMYLFESYPNAESCPDSDRLTRKLTAAGFDDDEINEAIAWLSAMQDTQSGYFSTRIDSVATRHFATEELTALAPESRQFLNYAFHEKMITATEREIILDRALALRQKSLPLDKLKLVMLMILWRRDQDVDAMFIEELLIPTYSKQLH